MSNAKTSNYRPEIQGVRAVAALLVAAYHIWFGRVSGGVDVFFVVSGFLITGSLIRQTEAQGRVHFLAFWAGLIKRLVPAALTVATITIIASFLILPQTVWTTTIKQAAAALFYVENWSQALSSIDYLADRGSASPFQHYWALSVQGQFYFLWPFIVTLLLWVAARASRRPRVVFLFGLAGIFLVSLAYSVITTRIDQAFAYFDTFARMWEFALGGLLVFLLPRLRLNNLSKAILGWGGLAAVVSCGFLLPVDGVFPGYAALWPTLGAAAVLAAGSDCRYGANLILASRPIAWFGDISYSFYLWHWPLFIFFMVLTGATQPSFAEGTGLILMAGILAWMTTRWIEEPARFSRIGKARSRYAYAFGAACCMPAIALLGLWSVHTLAEKSEARQLTIAADDPRYPGAAALAGKRYERSDRLHPNLLILSENVPKSYFDGCHQNIKGIEAIHCEYGDPDGQVTIALVGGSHSTQWLPALEVLAHKHGWKILSVTKSRCWFSSEVRPGSQGTCQAWNQNVLRVLEEKRPDYVFTTATRAQGAEESVPDGYVDQWVAMDNLGIQVIAVRDNPWWKGISPSNCVGVFGEASMRCQIPRESVLADVNPITTKSLPENMHLLDLTPFLCGDAACYPVAGNILIYRDRHHISKAYMLTLAPFLEKQLDATTPELTRRTRMQKTGKGIYAAQEG